MQKKILPVLLAVSVVANIFLGYTLYSQKQQEQTKLNNSFNAEISFAVSRRQDFCEKGDSRSYLATAAHVYARCRIYEDSRNYDYIYHSRLDELYNVLSLLPQYTSREPEELLEALQGLDFDRQKSDIATLTKFTSRIRAQEQNEKANGQ